MILSQCNFFSKTLNNHVDVNVLLPSLPDNSHFFHSYSEIYAPRCIPVLYLLHGALDDYSMWLRQTNVERYAEAAQIAVVMPSGQNSFYSNAEFGFNYFDYITTELPHLIEYTFPVARSASCRYIAGSSMGGYGAAKCALSKPEYYRAFGNFSGAADPEKLEPLMAQMGFDFFRYDLIFGGAHLVTGSKNDLKVLIRQCQHQTVKPQAWIACGKQDSNNYSMNLELHQVLQKAGFDSSFTDDSGSHDWVYWDHCLDLFIQKIQHLSSLNHEV